MVFDVLLECLYWLQLSETCLRVDDGIKNKVIQLVSSGVFRVSEVRRHLKTYVETVLFNGVQVPSMSDARYWPSTRVLLGIMYRTKCRNRLY